MSLTSKDINFILNLLNEDTCGSSFTFEQISNEFHREISRKDYLRVGNTLVLLLQNRDLIPTSQQRLIIFYLFIEMYKNEQQQQAIEINPFAPVFLSILQGNSEHSLPVQKHFHWIISSISKFERSFVRLLIDDYNQKDLFKKTPNEILQMTLPDRVQKEQEQQQQKFKEKMLERTQQLPVIVQCHLPAVINDPEMNNYGFDLLLDGPPQRSKDNRQTIERLLSSNVVHQTIHPEYLRLVPPLHECTIDELVWLSPDIDDQKSLFSWDSSMCIFDNMKPEIHFLMDKAYQGAINLSEQQKILDSLDTNPDLITHIGLLPSKFSLLVENNPLISVCLLKLLSSDQMTEYLQSLVNMNMSLHSMEVVNRLSTSMELPKEFLHSYISTCIRTCDETKDKYLQGRFVRLVSVFIQSLIRNKVIDIQNRFFEVQSFCLNYRQMKEASTLYQLLQTFDVRPNDHSNTTTTTTVYNDE